MPELAAGGLRDAGQLIQPAIGYVSEALALVCSLAPATEVALTATVLRELLDQLGRLGLDFSIMRDHGDERYADGVEDGIGVGRAQVLAEQAAAVESRRASFHVVRQRPATGSHPVMPHAGSA